MRPPGAVAQVDWGESIIDAIESSRIMVLIFSPNANGSSQIKREVERAVDKNVYTIPFRVEDIEPTKSLEYFISTSQWMDAFSPPLEQHLDKLARAVKTILARPAVAQPKPAASRRNQFGGTRLRPRLSRLRSAFACMAETRRDRRRSADPGRNSLVLFDSEASGSRERKEDERGCGRPFFARAFSDRRRHSAEFEYRCYPGRGFQSDRRRQVRSFHQK